VSNFEWNPDAYLDEIVQEVTGFHRLQEAVAAATAGTAAHDVLELGIGTGETALRVRALHPAARWTAIDASEPMLERARERMPDADLRVARLEDELPPGPFDLVVSCLAVHHLDGAGKRDLFRRVARVLRPGGRFVLGDVVVPERAEDVVVEIDWVLDLPDTVADQVAWLEQAGLAAETTWTLQDLAVVRAAQASA
jgi:tRNA (cmo5U34)-methyltransferase